MDFLHDCAAFVFDMDGLLFDTERMSRRALHAAADELGVPLPEDAFLELIGRRMGDIHGRLAKRVGNAALATQLLECSEKQYEIFLTEGVPVKEGVAELLGWLATQGKPCAVATSTRTAKAERKLASANLRQYFHTVVGGDQVERGKPAPDIYLHAATLLGVAIKNCGVFEDSEPGLTAAHAAGARVVWVPDLAPVDVATQQLASARADSLRDVFSFLSQRKN
ncbi:MAG TPA: HAD family phosphatase [Opitutales bacterium]|jgi:HAD superfamily hydrolase (TIGR01509 family)|nr:HAD family phosphatase [Opitutales bacterium]